MTTALEPIVAAGALGVRQVEDISEAITGWETANKYEVLDAQGTPVLYAGEVGGSFLSRGFLKNKRPFTLELRRLDGSLALTVKRPWRWFFSRAELFDGGGQFLGAVQQKFSLLRRIYVLEDDQGRANVDVVGPMFRPWTFELRRQDRPAGAIRKQWSGFLKEAFTDADNFGLELGDGLETRERLLSLAATFLIDFVHFERSD